MTRRLLVFSLAVALVSLVSSACMRGQAAEWAAADMILTGGTVVTVDDDFTIVEALAIKDGQIIAVGSAAEVAALAGPGTRTIDLAGKTVIPGLQDSHIHFLSLGRDVTYEAELTFAMSAEEIVAAIVELRERLDPEPGEWLIGNRWDQYKYPEMVTRWQLDEVTPGNPVWLNRVYRGVAISTAGFELMGIDDEDPSTWPDWWLEDPADFTFEDKIFRAWRTLTINGETDDYLIPTGAFLGVRGSRLVTVQPMARAGEGDRFESDVDSVRLGAQEMLRLGVTSIVDPASGMGYNMRVYQEALNRDLLGGLRISSVHEGIFTDHTTEQIRRHLDGIKINNLGGPYLKWRGTKWYSDGGAGTRSAWVSDSFELWEEFEGEENFGYPVLADNAVREAQYRVALEYGWDLHTHVCGDVAMRQAVDLYMKLMDETHAERPDADLRWSLIHAYLPIEEKTRVLEQMAEYGIIASCNPVFQWQEGASFSTNLGAERMARTQPFRSYVDAGVVLTSGSDYPVTSHDPWIGMYALLTRKSQSDGQAYGTEETLGIEDTLRTYTINGAWLTYEEDFKGSLEVGKVADLVILDLPDIRDLEENPALLFEMRARVLMTMTAGAIRYEKE